MSEIVQEGNNNIVLVIGESDAGKSTSLRNLPEQEGVYYLSCEANKKPPFKNKFQCASVTDPEDIFDYFDAAEEDDECHTIIIDTLTFLMDQYESLYVVDSKNTQQAWGAYAQFFKSLIQDYAARSTKNIIILAHVADVIDNATGDSKTIVKVKGSIMNNGVESYFNNIVLARKVSTDVLKGVENDYLNITEKEKRLKSKYVSQPDKTKDTLQYRNRFPIDMWDDSELFIDNDICHVLERLIEFYEED